MVRRSAAVDGPGSGFVDVRRHTFGEIALAGAICYGHVTTRSPISSGDSRGLTAGFQRDVRRAALRAGGGALRAEGAQRSPEARLEWIKDRMWCVEDPPPERHQTGVIRSMAAAFEQDSVQSRECIRYLRRRWRTTPIPIGVARTNRRSRVAPSPNGSCHPSPTPNRGDHRWSTRSPN